MRRSTLLIGPLVLGLAAACTSAPAEKPPVVVDAPPMRLVSYSDCDALLDDLRASAVKRVGPFGFDSPYRALDDVRLGAGQAPSAAKAAAPESSGTNVHEAGADEPDLVKNDGNRIVMVTGRDLKIIDTATRRVTRTVRLAEEYANVSGLLMSGDRVLVFVQGFDGRVFKEKLKPGFAPPSYMGLRILQIDLLTGKTLGEITAKGDFVDARQSGSVARVVVRTRPDIAFRPRDWNGKGPYEKWAKPAVEANREVVRNAGIEAFQPTFEVGGRKVVTPCEQISRPAGSDDISMVSVLTVDLAQDLGDGAPVSVVADGDTVYGTGASLYIAATPWAPGPQPWEGRFRDWRPSRTVTQVHKFTLTGADRPAYVASGEVKGGLLNQYSLSEHQGNLRVATSIDTPRQENSVTVLAPRGRTLKRIGGIDHLGKDERIYGVRFLGDKGYVVTFRQMDPLYAIDLADPAKPVALGELKITGYSAYLHPTADGRLIGVGVEADAKGAPQGAQVSLFDVTGPKLLDRLVFPRMWGPAAEYDPHAFLYWPKTGLTVVPVQDREGAGSALVLTVSGDTVKRVGTIRHPGRAYENTLQRAVLIGDALWTVSPKGVQVNDAATLRKLAWIGL
ncbi:beta-propeller domain-containing protein [Actinocorallia longicatena]|uniref:Beta propeller domain-containing protein n=1 Tax=Actinocorallia longicatena TaxID=111803 RepID=A0ABP6Q1X1_9ACTN